MTVTCDGLHRFVLEHIQSRDGTQDQENASMSQTLSSSVWWGVGAPPPPPLLALGGARG